MLSRSHCRETYKEVDKWCENNRGLRVVSNPYVSPPPVSGKGREQLRSNVTWTDRETFGGNRSSDKVTRSISCV